MNHHNRNETTNATTRSRPLASTRILAILLVLALVPDLVSARYGSCNRNRYHHPRPYPRRYDSHWGNYYGYGHHGCGRRSSSCHRRRQFHPVIDLFQDMVDASLNSLARQRKRVSVEQHRPRYFVEDYGRDGLELTLEIGSLTAREIDLELTQNDEGSRVLIVRGIPNRHGRRQVSELYQSFVLNDDSIDVDGISANVSSSNGVLTISLPRRKQSKRKRPSVGLRDVLQHEESEGENILVYDTKRGDFTGSNNNNNDKKKNKKKKRSPSKPIVAEEETLTRRKESTQQSKVESQDADDDGDGLWISEAEDIW